MNEFLRLSVPGQSILIGVVGLLLIYIIFCLFNFKLPSETKGKNLGLFNPLKAIVGADGRASTSKLQFFLWTIVILFTAITFCSWLLLSGNKIDFANLPPGLLLAMGFSIGTATAAKGITVSYINSGVLNKPSVDRDDKSVHWDAVFKDDSGFPDLTKMQILAWTFIATGIYLALVFNIIYKPDLSPDDLKNFPDIDPALIVLMGLGHGAYLGKKLITSRTPGLNLLLPSSGKAKTEVEIRGISLGDSGQITLDYKPIDSKLIKEWSDTSIKFTFPDLQSDGTAWTTEQKVDVRIIVNGQESVNSLPFTIV